MAAVFGVVMTFLMATRDESLPGLEQSPAGFYWGPIPDPSGGLCARETRWSRQTTSRGLVALPYDMPYDMPYARAV